MKNPWVRFLLLRLGTFVLILAIMLLLRFDPYFSSIISAVLALAISLIFFGKQRDELSKSIYEARNKSSDSDSNHEDAVEDEN